MKELPRHTITSLIARYKLHPQMIDIFVEGRFDKRFLDLVIADRGLTHSIKVYEIETIEIPNELIEEINNLAIFPNLPLDFGSHKHRVISLAYQISRSVTAANASCLADSDCDRLLNSLRQTKHLFYTDYSCMETYALRQDVLQSFFEFHCNLSSTKADEFLRLAEKILPTLFVLRSINQELALKAPVPSYAKATTKKGGIKSFDSEKFISQYIQENNLHEKNLVIRSRFNELLEIKSNDLRQSSQGHDFIELLYDFIMAHGAMKFSDKEIQVRDYGSRILMSALPSRILFSEPVFFSMERAVSSQQVTLWP